MTDSARYMLFKVQTACSHCGNPLVINGPARSPVCSACQNTVRVGPGLWQSIMEDIEKNPSSLKKGEGYSSTLMSGGFTFKIDYSRSTPICADCKTEWDLDSVADGTDGFFTCTKCGHKSVTYPAPDWLKSVIPTAMQVFFGEREESGTKGDTPLKPDQEAVRPVVLTCPQCGGSLKITAQNERTTPCSYCGVDVYLPDALWLKLHPIRTAKSWIVRFSGDYRALRKQLKEAKKEEKKKKKE